MARLAAILLAALFTACLAGCSREEKGPPKPKPRPTGDGVSVRQESKVDIHDAIAVIETAKGEIEIEFFADDAPQTVENFLRNARLGYYKGESFHRVEPGLLIQAGSHMVSDTIPIEASDRRPARGVIVMAKAEGAAEADAAEFFICLDTLELDGEYTLFGRVVGGLDVIDGIRPGDRIVNVTARGKGE